MKYCTCKDKFIIENINGDWCFNCNKLIQTKKSLKLSQIAKKAVRDSHGRFYTPRLTVKKLLKEMNQIWEDTSIEGRLTSLEAQLKNLKQDYRSIDRIQSRLDALNRQIRELQEKD